MNRSTETYSDKLRQLKDILNDADAVVIGAGSGLSTAAGFTYSGERFKRYFHDFTEKYHIRDIYSGGFYPFQTFEEYWAWWSRHIWINRYMNAPKPVYNDLLALVRDKDYFVRQRMWIIVSRKQDLISEECFIPRGITGCSSAVIPAIATHMITRLLYAKW